MTGISKSLHRHFRLKRRMDVRKRHQHPPKQQDNESIFSQKSRTRDAPLFKNYKEMIEIFEAAAGPLSKNKEKFTVSVMGNRKVFKKGGTSGISGVSGNETSKYFKPKGTFCGPEFISNTTQRKAQSINHAICKRSQLKGIQFQEFYLKNQRK